MFRPTATRSIVAPVRGAALNRTAAKSVRYQLPAQPLRNCFRRYATEQPKITGDHSNNTQTIVIVVAIIALAGGGYFLLKPVSDAAYLTKGAIKTVQSGTEGMGNQATDLAKAFLPPDAFVLFSNLSSQSGGLNGFLSSLKDKDLQVVMDEIKKVGGDDVTRIAEKVEKKIKDAGGKVQNVDWKGLILELKQELPKDKQYMVDTLIGQIPDKADFEKYISQAKELGQEQLKAAEKAAGKIWEKVEKAKKEGKGQADAFITGLKQSAPSDVDDLVKQIKETAKKAGLPADQIESWLKHKADEKNIDPEQLGKQVEDKLRTATKFLPSDPEEVVKQVESVSPSLAKLLRQALVQAEVLKK